MDTEEKIETFLDNLAEPKGGEMQALHAHILHIFPRAKRWFLRATVSDSKHSQTSKSTFWTKRNALGSSKAGKALPRECPHSRLPHLDKRVETLAWAAKASITGYWIKFKTLKDIRLNILDEAMRYGIKHIEND